MTFEIELNQLYRQIAQQQINDMIPTKWDSFNFNGEVRDGAGGVFFFFKPKDEEQYMYCHYILNVHFDYTNWHDS